MLISAVKQSDSVMHTHPQPPPQHTYTCILFFYIYILFLYGLSEDTEHSSLNYTVGPCFLQYFLNFSFTAWLLGSQKPASHLWWNWATQPNVTIWHGISFSLLPSWLPGLPCEFRVDGTEAILRREGLMPHSVIMCHAVTYHKFGPFSPTWLYWDHALPTPFSP